MDNMIYDINLNYLKYFYLVSKFGSFTKASEALYLSQPNISYAVKQLEKILNAKLLIRERSGVKLTPMGEKVYHNVEKLFENLNEFGFISKLNFNELSFSIGIQSHVYLFFQEKIQNFIQHNPNIKFNFYSDSTQDLIEKLKQNEIDVIIDVAPISFTGKNLQILNLRPQKLCFIANSPIKEKLVPQNLDKFKFILPSEQSNIRKLLDVNLNNQKIIISPFIICNSTNITTDLVMAGAGVGLVFENTVTNYLSSGKLFKVKTSFILPTIPLCIVVNKENTNNILYKFIQYLQNKE